MKYQEKAQSKNLETNSMALADNVKEANYERPMHWNIVDELVDSKSGELIKSVNHRNLVVNGCSTIIAMLMAGQGKGIQYWAVGKGLTSWGNDNPPEPKVGDTLLTAESFRKAIQPTDISYLDDNYEVTTKPTNKLQIKVTFTESEANGELREFGLFGGDATTTKNSGTMINRRTHGLIYKTSGMRLIRTIQITF